MGFQNLYICACIAGSTACMFGYGTGYIGGILVLPSFNHHFGLDHLSERDRAAAQSLIVSIWILGAFLGVLCALPICSRFGRKACLGICGTTYVSGAAMQFLPWGNALVLFNIGRLLNGAGVGAGTLVAPLYLSEVSPPTHRGMLLASWQVGMQVSALIGFWGAYISHKLLPNDCNWQWYVPVLLQLVPGTILLVGSAFLPESPVWLAETHNLPTLQQSVSWLFDMPSSAPEVRMAVESYSQLVEERKRASRIGARQGLVKELNTPSIRKRLVCGIVLMSLMTLSGTNALNFFAPVIFMSAGFTSTSTSLLLTGLFGLVKLTAALTFMFYAVHVRGHRFWTIVSTTVCAISLLILAFCVRTFEAGQGHQTDSEARISVVGIAASLMVFIFAFFFGVGHGPIAWNFCAEVFPSHISTLCCTITTCTQWFFQVINAVATPLLLTSAGWYTWVIFSLVNAVTLAWCVVYVPETRGVPLGLPMDAVFGDKKSMYTGDPTVCSQDFEATDETSPLLRT